MKSQQENEQEVFECSNCKSQVDSDDEFCTECGTIFVDGINCSVHAEIEAEGVCVICCLPFCNQCGTNINKHFLCHTHSEYEIYQGMARVYGDLMIQMLNLSNPVWSKPDFILLYFAGSSPKEAQGLSIHFLKPMVILQVTLLTR